MAMNIYFGSLLLFIICQFINRVFLNEEMLDLLDDHNKLAITKETKYFRKIQSSLIFVLFLLFILAEMIQQSYLFYYIVAFLVGLLIISIVSSFILFKIYRRHKLSKQFYRLFYISRSINAFALLTLLLGLIYFMYEISLVADAVSQI